MSERRASRLSDEQGKCTRARTANLDGSLQLEQNRLVDEDLPGFQAQATNLVLREVDLLAGPRAPHLQELFDDGVSVDFVTLRS